MCCGTKRLVQISCPSDCSWLASAREHPPASLVRQQQRDAALITRFMRDLSRGQSELFFLISAFLARYQPPDLHAPIDDDVAEATGSLAATFETASRGLIYDHRPASVPAGRLATALKALLAEAPPGARSAFERDVAVVLRRVEESVRDVCAVERNNRQAFLDLLRRVIRQEPDRSTIDVPGEHSRLIVP